MKNIYYLFLGLMTILGVAACNNEWEDEQYLLQASFKANVTDQGVTTTYVGFNSGGVVKYNLPILMSGSTVNTQNRTIHIGLDPDTLAVLNEEQYGHREELYFRQLPSQYYNMPETVEMLAGESLAVLPVEFTLDESLDQSDKWVLPLQIRLMIIKPIRENIIGEQCCTSFHSMTIRGCMMQVSTSAI